MRGFLDAMTDVVIASDAPERRALLTALLRLHRHRVAGEADDLGGLKATLGKLDRSRPAPVLVLDVDLAEPGWTDVIRDYCESRGGSRTVLITPSRSVRTDSLAKQAKVDRVVYRPFAIHQLLEAVDPSGSPPSPPTRPEPGSAV